MPDQENPLDEREMLIMEYVRTGDLNKNIATKMGWCVSTVAHALPRIYVKLHARGRAHAVARMYDLGLFEARR